MKLVYVLFLMVFTFTVISHKNISQNDNGISQKQSITDWVVEEPQEIRFNLEYLQANPFEYLENAKNPQEIRELTIREIVKIGLHLELSNEMIAVLLLIARNETGNQFNPIKLSKIKNQTYKGGGIYQMTNNHTKTHSRCDNVVSGDDRHNLYKVIPALVKKMEYSREKIENQMGRWCDSWYYVRIHNPNLRYGEKLAKQSERALYRRTLNDVKSNKWCIVVNKIIDEIMFERNIENMRKFKEEMEIQIENIPVFAIIDNTRVAIVEF